MKEVLISEIRVRMGGWWIEGVGRGVVGVVVKDGRWKMFKR